MADQADINIQTQGLRTFAADSRIDLDVDSIRGQASAASNGASEMDEGVRFHQTHATALEQVLAALEAVKQGAYGFRAGAEQIADTYVLTEGQVTQTMASAPQPAAPTVSV